MITKKHLLSFTGMMLLNLIAINAWAVDPFKLDMAYFDDTSGSLLRSQGAQVFDAQSADRYANKPLVFALASDENPAPVIAEERHVDH